MSENILGLNTPNAYVLKSVTISNLEGDQYDLTDEVDSFELSESIYSMFLKGSITLVENNNVFNRINFTGQEFIRLHFAGMQGMSQEQEDEMAINHIFRVTAVNSYVRDTQLDVSKIVYGLKFCSIQMYEANIQRISKHYVGKNGEIIDKICTEYLNFKEDKESENSSKPLVKGGKEVGNFLSVKYTDKGEQSAFLCPNWTVAKAIKYLSENTSDDQDMPYGDSYYFFQTATDGFRFMNVSQMANIVYGKITDKDAPVFHLRDAPHELDAPVDADTGVGKEILNYNKMNIHNTLNGHKRGLYAGSISNYNTVTKQITTVNSQFDQQFKVDGEGIYSGTTISKGIPSFRLRSETVRVPDDEPAAVSESGKAEVLDSATELSNMGNPITERFGAVQTFSYSTPHVFSNVIETEQGLNDGSISSGNPAVKLNRERVEALFESNRINVQISGRTDINCGMLITLSIPQPDGVGNQEESTHSAEMLIEGVKWEGSRHGLETHLSCTTDGFQPTNALNSNAEKPELTQDALG